MPYRDTIDWFPDSKYSCLLKAVLESACSDMERLIEKLSAISGSDKSKFGVEGAETLKDRIDLNFRFIRYMESALLQKVKILDLCTTVERECDSGEKENLERATAELYKLWPTWRPTYCEPREGCWRGVLSDLDTYEDLPKNIDVRNLPYYYFYLKLIRK